jgi:murein L,D-transpeptidase YafK
MMRRGSAIILGFACGIVSTIALVSVSEAVKPLQRETTTSGAATRPASRQLSTTTPSRALRADAIRVEKSKRLLHLQLRGRTVRTYRIALGPSPVGPKECEGDGRTPEGSYTIDSRLKQSSYHRALHVSYPSRADVASARQRRCSPGGAIMIHGITNGLGWIGSGHAARDWTAGCIAVTNEQIEEIWNAVPNGTPIEIVP